MAGVSAGGHIALMLAVRNPDVACVMSLAGPTDLPALRTESNGLAAYQLAVVVDDAAQGVTEVIRGDDLIPSTPRQLLLYRLLGLEPPRFAHVPVVLVRGRAVSRGALHVVALDHAREPHAAGNAGDVDAVALLEQLDGDL